MDNKNLFYSEQDLLAGVNDDESYYNIFNFIGELEEYIENSK